MTNLEYRPNMGIRRTHIEYYRNDGFGNKRYYVKTGLKSRLIKQLLRAETITKEQMGIMSALFPVDFIEILTPDEETPL